MGELKKMTDSGIAFVVDAQEYALVFAGKVQNPSARPADSFNLIPFAVVRAEWIAKQAARAGAEGAQQELFNTL